MKSWKEIKFGELASFRNGLNFNNKSHGLGCKIIGIPDFGDKLIPDYQSLGEIIPDGIVKEEDYLKKGDIIFVRSNGNKNLVGRSLFINQVNQKLVYSGFCIRARVNPEKAFSLFYAYFFRTTLFRQLISGAAGGANIQNLNQGTLSRAIVPLPPLHSQRNIASILSAYDDLIENNLNRIKLLEELTQRTYEEWFVKFRVNGEQLEVNEETSLPEGWERKMLLDLAEVSYGYPFKSNQFNSEGKGTPIIRIRNVPNSDTNDFTTEKVDLKYMVEKGDLLIGMDGEFYVNNWSGPRAYLVQRSCNVKSKDKFLHGYLSQAIISPIKYFEATISGTTVAHLGKMHLETIKIVIPSKKMYQELEIFNKWLNSKMILSAQNRLLKESRDILLPRLMSGVINVDRETSISLSVRGND